LTADGSCRNPRRPTDSLLRGWTHPPGGRDRARTLEGSTPRPAGDFGVLRPSATLYRSMTERQGRDSGSSFTGSIAGHQPYIAVQLFQMDRETGLVEGLFQPPDQGIIFAL